MKWCSWSITFFYDIVESSLIIYQREIVFCEILVWRITLYLYINYKRITKGWQGPLFLFPKPIKSADPYIIPLMMLVSWKSLKKWSVTTVYLSCFRTCVSRNLSFFLKCFMKFFHLTSVGSYIKNSLNLRSNIYPYPRL